MPKGGSHRLVRDANLRNRGVCLQQAHLARVRCEADNVRLLLGGSWRTSRAREM